MQLSVVWQLAPVTGKIIINHSVTIEGNPMLFNCSRGFTQNFSINIECKKKNLETKCVTTSSGLLYIHGENFMAIFTTPSVVIWFSASTLGIFATLVYVFTMRVVICDILSLAIITTLSTSILFCNLCYILLWISSRSVVKIAIRI